MARAEFKPITGREVVLTMTETEAHTLRSIMGNSNNSQYGLYNVWLELSNLFEYSLPEIEREDWAIRKPGGSIYSKGKQ